MSARQSGPTPTGIDLIRNPALNKGSAFSEEERDRFGLRGLLPQHVLSQDRQAERSLFNLRRRKDDLDKYLHLADVAGRNERLFYRLLIDNLEELLPVVYTPTVGRACQVFGHIYRVPRGLFVTANDRGRVADVLRNWPVRDVRIIVVTDGGRILGLGDLGANGMGIPVGKLALYTACAGADPARSLPIVLDVGTNNPALLNDPLYIGLRQRRLTGSDYDELVEEFIDAVREVFGHCLIQFEDFATSNAFRMLHRYRERACTFNDDIQGTGAVALAGIYSALRITGEPLSAQRVLFLGAGEAGVGIADTIVAAMVHDGLTVEQARQHCAMVDSSGLVVSSRHGLAPHKQRYALDRPFVADFLEAVETLKPTAIVGVCGHPGQFTPQVLKAMARLNDRPIVFALSNPTSRSECTAEEAYRYTGGRAIFASGSPFAPVETERGTLVPGQCNNAYVFPGVGLGVVASHARTVSDEMFFAAARAIADRVTPAELRQGLVFPPIAAIRDVALDIAVAVADVARRRELTDRPIDGDLRDYVGARRYDPRY